MHIDQINALVSIKDLFQNDYKILPTPNFWMVLCLKKSGPLYEFHCIGLK